MIRTNDKNYRMVVTLPKVTRSLTVKVQLVVDEKPPPGYRKNPSPMPVSEYYYNGVQYFKVAPKPLLVMEIHSPEIREGWNANYQISFYQQGFYFLRKMVEEFVTNYQKHFQEFYERSNLGIRLTDTVREYTVYIPGNAGKLLHLQPSFREHPDIPDQVEYGCDFFIGSHDYVAFLPEMDLLFLAEQLKELHLMEIAMQLINADLAYHHEPPKPVGTLNLNYQQEVKPQPVNLDPPMAKPRPPQESIYLPQY